MRPALLVAVALALPACVFDRGGLPADPVATDASDLGAGDRTVADLQVAADADGAPVDAGDAGPANGPRTDLVPVDTLAPDTLPTAPFGSAVAIAALNSPDSEDDPTLTADMLEIFFDSARPGGKGGGDVWTATRSSLTSAWSTPQPVAALNSSDGETTPEVAPDGLTIHFCSHRPGGPGNGDIYVSTRSSRGSSWSPPMLVSELSSTDGDFAPTVSDDLRFMVMSSNRPGAGDFDLYTVSRSKATDPWGTPLMVTALDTSGVETDPWFNKARTVLYFATDRPGGKGDWDIWRALRSGASASFGQPSPVAELNSSSSDSDVWLSPDMTVVYFSSSRDGDSDLFVAKR